MKYIQYIMSSVKNRRNFEQMRASVFINNLISSVKNRRRLQKMRDASAFIKALSIPDSHNLFKTLDTHNLFNILFVVELGPLTIGKGYSQTIVEEQRLELRSCRDDQRNDQRIECKFNCTFFYTNNQITLPHRHYSIIVVLNTFTDPSVSSYYSFAFPNYVMRWKTVIHRQSPKANVYTTNLIPISITEQIRRAYSTMFLKTTHYYLTSFLTAAPPAAPKEYNLLLDYLINHSTSNANNFSMQRPNHIEGAILEHLNLKDIINRFSLNRHLSLTLRQITPFLASMKTRINKRILPKAIENKNFKDLNHHFKSFIAITKVALDTARYYRYLKQISYKLFIISYKQSFFPWIAWFNAIKPTSNPHYYLQHAYKMTVTALQKPDSDDARALEKARIPAQGLFTLFSTFLKNSSELKDQKIEFGLP